jgi:hypothetical protein
MVEPQGYGEIKKGLGAPILDLLESRRGIPTIVRLVDGQELVVYQSVWGRDLGDMWEHVTTHCSPEFHAHQPNFFLTSHVVSISDKASGMVLFEQEPRPDET